MSGVVFGLVLALVASVAINTSFAFQHAGSEHAPAVSILRPLETGRAILSSGRWLVGAVLGTGGWALQIVALAHAPLSLVQAFVAGGLAFALPVAALALGHRPHGTELRAVGLMALALVALSFGVGSSAHGSYHALTLGLYLGAATLLAAVIALLVRAPRWRAHGLGLAGGALYGVTDTGVKALTTVLAHHGLLGVLVSPLLYAAIVTGLLAFFCFARGLQTGRPLPVIGTMTAGTNIVSILGGFIVFADPLGGTTGLRIAHLLALIVVIVAAVLLAPRLNLGGQEPAETVADGAPS